MARDKIQLGPFLYVATHMFSNLCVPKSPLNIMSQSHTKNVIQPEHVEHTNYILEPVVLSLV